MQSMIVGLLSQAVDSKSTQRSMLPALLNIASAGDAPDILLCAGYTFGSQGELEGACNAFQSLDTLVVAEDNVEQKKRAGSLCWIYRGKSVRVGDQKMAESHEPAAHANSAIEAWNARMHENPRRSVKILWINCGEIFVFYGGKQNVSVRYAGTLAAVRSVLEKADLIVHPSHTRMARRFVADRIAVALTGGHVADLSSRYPKAYVHASNWEVNKGQRQNREALHKAFERGHDVQIKPVNLPQNLADQYLYSHVRIHL